MVSLTAAGAAIGGQWLLHIAEPQAPFAPFSLANWIIRRAPTGWATTAIEQLGHNALRALATATIAAAFGLALVLRRLRAPWLAGIAAVLTVAAAALDPVPRATTWTTAAAGLAAGAVLAVHMLGAGAGTPPTAGLRPGRRQFLAAAGLFVTAGVLGAQAVRHVARQRNAGVVRADRRAQVPSDAAFDNVAGLSPAVTPRGDHYIVDIDLDDPHRRRGVMAATDRRRRASGGRAVTRRPAGHADGRTARRARLHLEPPRRESGRQLPLDRHPGG
jgi:hypothetical protein